MVEMHDSEKWMKRIQSNVGRSHSLVSRLLTFLQDKLQLTKLIAGSEHFYGNAEDITWKVVENKEYIWTDSLVEIMLRVLSERCREEGTFNFTTKNLEKYGFETSELNDYFDIDAGEEDTKSQSSDEQPIRDTRRTERHEEIEMGSAETWENKVKKSHSFHV